MGFSCFSKELQKDHHGNPPGDIDALDDDDDDEEGSGGWVKFPGFVKLLKHTQHNTRPY